MKEPCIETDYYKCRKNAERALLKRRVKQLGIRWFIKQLFIWICFSFVPTRVGYDEENIGGHNLISICHAKYIFGTLYIIKSEQYLDGKLIRGGKKMTFKEMIGLWSV